MKTESFQTHRSGEVKTVNAVATIHKVLEQISSGGKIHCQMTNSDDESVLVFIGNGICATFDIQEFQPMQEGGVA